jgi:ABC-type multidrug transport system fused ATPase/permease subunit
MSGLFFLLKYTWKFNKSYIFYTISYQIISAITPLVGVVMPKYIIDELMGQKSARALAVYIGVLLGVNFFGGLLASFLRGGMFTSKGVVFNKFQCYITAKLAECDFEQLESAEFLDAKEKAHKFLYANGQGFGMAMDSAINILGKILIFAGIIAILLTLSIWMVFVFAALTLLNSIVDANVRKKYTQWDMEKAPIERRTSYLIHAIEDFGCGKEIRLYNIKNFLLGKIAHHLDESNAFYRKQTRILNRSQYFNTFTTLMRDGLAYIYLVFKVTSGEIGIGNFSMYIGAVYQFSGAMNDFMRNILEIRQFSGYYDALNKYMNIPSNMREGRNLPLPSASGYVIEFKNVSYKYSGQNDFALKNISLKIESKMKLSIVGENGAGKTTLVKLLMRLYDPQEGQITLNGIDIKDISYDAYQSVLSAVFQDYKLFSFTIKENIVFEKDETDSAVAEYLARSGFKNKLENLGHGIQTNIYKNFEPSGFEPSGGESQKIALARALYKNSPIVILDEPTAALDPRAEYEIYQNFNDLVSGKTAIYISHRLSSARFCDAIAVMRHGEIIEYGAHGDLLKANGLYAELFNMQAQFYVKEH